MRASSPTARGNRSWRRVELPPEHMAAIGVLLRDAGPVFGDGDPVSAYAHFDRADRPRRIHAAFSNGWRATLVIYVDGTCSLSQALKMRGEIKGSIPA